MKKTQVLILFTILLMACGKGDESLPRDKFLGTYDLYEKHPDTHRGRQPSAKEIKTTR